jgi:hypothetical protein
MRFPALWLGTPCEGADPLEAEIAAAGAQFPTGERVEINLPERGPSQKFIGCVAEKVEGFDRDYVFVLHEIFPFAVGFLEHAETGSRTTSRRVTRKGERATRERKRRERAAR